MSKHIFTTSAGVEIPLNAIPPMQGQMVEQAARKKAAELFGEPVKPTYTIPTDDGGEEIHEHDEETIKDNPAAQRAWDEWQTCLSKTSEYVNTKLLDFVLLTGTDALLPEDESWIETQQFLGIEVPEQSMARRAHYIKTEVLRTVNDINGIQSAITAISGINQEALAAARATFQRDAQDGREPGNDDGTVGPEEIQLDGEPTILGDADGESVGEDSERVGRAKRRR